MLVHPDCQRKESIPLYIILFRLNYLAGMAQDPFNGPRRESEAMRRDMEQQRETSERDPDGTWVGHWEESDLIPKHKIFAFEYQVSAERPILANIKTYTADEALETPRFDVHYALECGFVMSGKMVRYTGSMKNGVMCEPGDVWFCPSCEPNGYDLVELPCKVAVFEARPEFVSDLIFPEAPKLDWLSPFTAPRSHRLRTSSDNWRPQILDIGRRMEETLERESKTRAVDVRLLFLEFLLIFARDSSGKRGRPRIRPRLRGKVWPAIELALRSRRLVTNEQAATACDMTVPQFIRVFRKTVGSSFAKFALHRRLQGALEALTQTDEPVKAIAAHWGFSDASHLHHLFVEHFHCTPAEYRRRVAQGNGGAVVETT